MADKDIKEEIKRRIDIVELISQYVPLKKAGRRFKARCPFHEEKTASFFVDPVAGLWHCFGCGAGGDVFSLASGWPSAVGLAGGLGPGSRLKPNGASCYAGR